MADVPPSPPPFIPGPHQSLFRPYLSLPLHYRAPPDPPGSYVSDFPLSVLILGPTTVMGQAMLDVLTAPSLASSFRVCALIPPCTLLHQPSLQQQWKERGIQIIAADILSSPEEALVSSFTQHAVHTVISCVIEPQLLEREMRVLFAALRTPSFKRFLPSSWQFDVGSIGWCVYSVYDEQLMMRRVLERSGCDYLIVVGGLWYMQLSPVVTGIDLERGTIRASGSADNTVVLSDAEDIAYYTAHILLEDTLRKGVVYLGAERLSYRQFAERAGKALGKEIEVSVVPAEEIEAQLANSPDDYVLSHQRLIALQQGVDWPLEITWNYTHTQKKPLSIEEFLLRNYLPEKTAQKEDKGERGESKKEQTP